MAKSITRIDAKKPDLLQRKRVAAYARVSMDTERLMHSLSVQVSYYSELIQNTPGWEYAGVYADEGITGTKMDSRPEFIRMLADCEAGKIDIILTKSLSRFARNTVDTLNVVRSFDAIRSTVFSTDALEAELAQVEAEMSIAAEQVARSIRENAMVALDQSAYRARHDALCDRYESLKARCAELKETISDKQTRLAAIDDFLRTLMKQEALPTAFDPMTYHILVERMTVYGKDKVMVRFKNGMEIQA